MYLGVDGGGTKTAFALIDGEGNLLARHQETGSYYLDIGVSGVEKILHSGIQAILAEASCSAEAIRHAFFGIPAYGEDSGMTATLDKLPSSMLPPHKYRCDNDMICGWAGSLGCQDGINIVAGTGSISYGERAGHSARCGGWGELFGDEGSAYWIGRCGLALFSRMSDGRAKSGPLREIFREKFDLTHDLDMSSLVLNEWQSDRGKIAQMSLLVYQAAEAGDALAREIFDRAAAELAEIIDATQRQLNFGDNEEIPVSYSGGVFNAGSMIIDPLSRTLNATNSHYHLVAPRYEPLIGAAIYAAKCGGVIFSAETLTHLQRQLASTTDFD